MAAKKSRMIELSPDEIDLIVESLTSNQAVLAEYRRELTDKKEIDSIASKEIRIHRLLGRIISL